MSIELKEIPGLQSSPQDVWRVRALVIASRDPVLPALASWAKFYPKDYKAIMKAMRLTAYHQRVPTEKHVKKSARHDHVYEIIAYTLTARLMFFYDNDGGLVICTTQYEKGRGSQDAAFDNCEDLRQYYLKHKNEKKPSTSAR